MPTTPGPYNLASIQTRSTRAQPTSRHIPTGLVSIYKVNVHAFSFVENTNLQSHHLGAELRRQRGTVVAQELWRGMCLWEGSVRRAKLLLTMTLRPSEAPTIGTMPLKLGGSCICPWGCPVSHSLPAEVS